MIQFR